MRPRFVRGRWAGVRAGSQVLAQVEEELPSADDVAGHALLVTIEGLDAAGVLGEPLEGKAIEKGFGDTRVELPELRAVEGSGFECHSGFVTDGALAAKLGGADDVGQLGFDEVAGIDDADVLLAAPVIAFGVLAGEDDGGGSEALVEAVVTGR